MNFRCSDGVRGRSGTTATYLQDGALCDNS